MFIDDSYSAAVSTMNGLAEVGQRFPSLKVIISSMGSCLSKLQGSGGNDSHVRPAFVQVTGVESIAIAGKYGFLGFSLKEAFCRFP